MANDNLWNPENITTGYSLHSTKKFRQLGSPLDALVCYQPGYLRLSRCPSIGPCHICHDRDLFRG